jgi:uncharacterized protein YegL
MEKELTIDDALDNVPTQVGETFLEFKSQKDILRAVKVMEQINVVYERALTQKDSLGPSCEDKRAELAHEVSLSRSALKDVEGHLTRLQGHMQSIQSGIDRNLAEVESLRDQYKAHKSLCKKNQEDSAALAARLQEDMPSATALVKKALYTCTAANKPPELLQCSLPNGEFVTTFKDKALRAGISKSSGVVEKIISLNLDRVVRSRAMPKKAAASFLQTGSRKLRGSSPKSSHSHRQHRHRHVKVPAAKGAGLLQRSLAQRQVPKTWCSEVKPAPACESLSDSLATALGNVEDLLRDLLGKSQANEDHCRESLESYDMQVRSLQRDADDGSVALASAAAEHGELANLRRERRAEVQDVNRESLREVATCSQQLQNFETTLCSTKKLRKELGKLAGEGNFLGDCEVSDWVRGPCNASCGDTGVQTLTREVIHAPGNKKCPGLELTRPCNRRQCPVDGVMSHWEAWSGCTRSCGGGTRARHRRVLVEARHGGLPTAETMQEQLCNTQACDQDCLLADWTNWTSCSKVCNTGHKSRVRKILRPALGDGTCTDAKSKVRLATERCNEKACSKALTNAAPKCSQVVDVALVLDVSGSVGAVGTEKLKLFAKLFIDSLEPKNTTLGIVSFGSTATIASPLSSDRAALEKSLTAVTFQKTSTNTAQALGVTRSLVDEHGRPQAQQVVIVVTDGMPESSFLTGVEVSRLKEQGARLVFVAVGKSVSRHVLRGWASWPWEENVVTAASFGSLDQKKVTEVLANVCGDALK